MAKRKRKSSKNFKLKHPREVGKFYRMSDSKNGHPGRVFYSDPGEDVYFVIKFTSHARKDRKKMLHNIDPRVDAEPQYFCKNPLEISFDDMTYVKDYELFRIHKDDFEKIKNVELLYLQKKKK